MLGVIINILILYFVWRLAKNPPDFMLKIRYGNTNKESKEDVYKSTIFGIKIIGFIVFLQFLYHLYILLV
jgi:hypothetical protein